jgi:4-amino-4-deoxy-L-arabinose transferase-like glycosyltransferase
MNSKSLFCVLLVVFGAARIVSTYHVFSQTTDEPAHIACGMEWLERGTYTFEAITPPLARIATAIGPYLAGIRLKSDENNKWRQGNAILAANGRYIRNLSLARLGILPFFAFGAFIVWYWANTIHGNQTALWAVLLFTTCPVVLAHAGLATTDFALAACCSGALFVLVQWLENPTYLLSVILGVLIGCAILSKFSGLIFLLVSALAFLCAKLLLNRRGEHPDHIAWYKASALTLLIVFLVLWAGYRFSIGPLATGNRSHLNIDRLVKTHGAIHNAMYAVVESPLVPMPPFWQGLLSINDYNSFGHKSYLLGDIRQHGWWYFFPVALSVKTPIPLLILSISGVFYVVFLSLRHKDWVIAAPVLAGVGIMIVAMRSHLDLGVRYVLPIYPLFAIIGAVAVEQLLKRKSRHIGFAFITFLLAWQFISSCLAHPDYLAYFNGFAGRHPENVLLDSDLDWGQDVLRLSQTLRENHVSKFSVMYSGTADLSNFDLPPYDTLEPYERTTGWVAISLLPLMTGDSRRPDYSFAWLEAYPPFCTVGRSMRLYHLPNQEMPGSPQR